MCLLTFALKQTVFIGWRPIQGGPLLSPLVSRDRLQSISVWIKQVQMTTDWQTVFICVSKMKNNTKTQLRHFAGNVGTPKIVVFICLLIKKGAITLPCKRKKKKSLVPLRSFYEMGTFKMIFWSSFGKKIMSFNVMWWLTLVNKGADNNSLTKGAEKEPTQPTLTHILAALVSLVCYHVLCTLPQLCCKQHLSLSCAKVIVCLMRQACTRHHVEIKSVQRLRTGILQVRLLWRFYMQIWIINQYCTCSKIYHHESSCGTI